MLNKILVLWCLKVILLLDLCVITKSLQLAVGECPLIYNEPCSSDLIEFILSTRINNETKLYQLNPFKLSFPEGFNARLPTKVLIHGYGGLFIDTAIKKIYAAYEEIGYNVILVNWGSLALVPCYATAYLNTWHVGQCIAILAVSLIPFGIDPSFLHLVGFSLGAHIAGFAGTNMRNALKKVPGRITGLDPALPFFATLNKEWKLDSSDAKFVDVVHTSAGTFGKIEALGHADFYMNGGVLQPGCYDAPRPPICSHVMSGHYFAETVKADTNFVGVKCENLASYMLGLCSGKGKAVMGEYVDTRTRGSYFVDTSDLSPVTLGYVYENFIT